MSWSSLEAVLTAIRTVVPALTASKHKGQAGKIAVIGGCREYTGAPFFAAISALKLGADLSHVFCTQGAATVIKSYSPELIVHPVMWESHEARVKDDKERRSRVKTAVNYIKQWLPRFSCLVLGPGMGQDELVRDTVMEVMRRARAADIPMVIDGDALRLINANPELVQGYPLAILTPNVNELRRLVNAILGEGKGRLEQDKEQLKQLAFKLGGVTIMEKGSSDLISDGLAVLDCGLFGSPRRCGGQGDVTAGSTAVFFAWAHEVVEQQKGKKANDTLHLLEDGLSSNPAMVAAFAGSMIVRHAAQAAFEKHKRSMNTTDLIAELGTSMQGLFPVGPSTSSL